MQLKDWHLNRGAPAVQKAPAFLMITLYVGRAFQNMTKKKQTPVSCGHWATILYNKESWLFVRSIYVTHELLRWARPNLVCKRQKIQKASISGSWKTSTH